MMQSPVICNVRYDDMGSLRNVERFGDIARPANHLPGQRDNFVAGRFAEKVRNNSVKTRGLLKSRNRNYRL